MGPYGYDRYGYDRYGYHGDGYYGYYYGDYDPCCDCAGTSASRQGSGNSGGNAHSGGGTTGCCCCCFYPLAWLLRTFPRAPDNIQGGLLGLCAGTHALRSTYAGSSRWGACDQNFGIPVGG